MILLHRMIQNNAAGMSGASIGYTKLFYIIITLQNGLPLGIQNDFNL